MPGKQLFPKDLTQQSKDSPLNRKCDCLAGWGATRVQGVSARGMQGGTQQEDSPGGRLKGKSLEDAPVRDVLGGGRGGGGRREEGCALGGGGGVGRDRERAKSKQENLRREQTFPKLGHQLQKASVLSAPSSRPGSNPNRRRQVPQLGPQSPRIWSKSGMRRAALRILPPPP